MSNRYRDDIHEIIAYSNHTWGQQSVVTDEVLRVAESLQVGIRSNHADDVVVIDDVIDRRIQGLGERIVVSDQFIGWKRHIDWIEDKIKASDQVKTRLHAQVFIDDVIDTAIGHQEHYLVSVKDAVSVAESIVATKHSRSNIVDKIVVREQLRRSARYRDDVTDHLIVTDVFTRHKIRSLLHERITFQENWRNTRHSHIRIYEKIGIKDRVVARFNESIIEQVQGFEQYQQRLFAKQYIADSISYSEEFKQLRRVREWISDELVILTQPTGQLYARQFIHDLLFLDEDVLGEHHRGFAWTANVDTWAMSRYDNYQFDGLTVIDGVLYGVNDDGVFRVDTHDNVNAKIVTGKLDLGNKGQLVHPVAAYLEYELSGHAKKLEIGVSTTQSGGQQTYYYPLPNEPADHLTNGRVVFGRGLRGRHFAFEFRISGESGYINDVSIDVTATKRRI